MAQRNTSSFKSTKNSRYADNTAGDVSAEDSRDMFEDVADSFLNTSDFPMAAGPYTATITGLTGIDSVDSQNLWYLRINNIVIVRGVIELTSNVNTSIDFRISLPIAKVMINENDISGQFGIWNLVGINGFIRADTSEDEAVCYCVGTNGPDVYNINFSYKL